MYIYGIAILIAEYEINSFLDCIQRGKCSKTNKLKAAPQETVVQNITWNT